MTGIGDIWRDLPDRRADFLARLRQTGAQGERIAAFDWATTPLGPIADWPPSLRTVVHTLAASGQPMCLWYGPELTTVFNAAFAPILGARAETALGRRLDEVWPEVFADLVPLARMALSGETVWREEMPLTMTRNGFEERTFWTFSYSPVLDDAGRIAGFLDVVTEATAAVADRAARERAESQQTALRRELLHRMHNMLAVLKSMIVQSLRAAPDLAAAERAATGRIEAYARVQEIFSDAGIGSADIVTVIESALAPHASERRGQVEIDGAPLRLGQQQSLGVALAVHELATNALKFGALSVDAGRVAVRWRRTGKAFAFEWRESGGPPVASPPRRQGFGTALTERIVPGYFTGEAARSYDSAGVTYVLRGTLDDPET